MRPRSLGESARPRPKWWCQTRLTIERQVSTFAGSVSQRARAARRLPSSSGSGRENLASRPGTQARAPGVAGAIGLLTSPRLRMWTGRGPLLGLKLDRARSRGPRRRPSAPGGGPRPSRPAPVDGRLEPGGDGVVIRGQLVLLRPAPAIGRDREDPGDRVGQRPGRATGAGRSVTESRRRPIRWPRPCDCSSTKVSLVPPSDPIGSPVSKTDLVGLADLGMDAPGRRRIAVDRHRGRPSLLVEVGGGVPEDDRHGGASDDLGAGLDLELGEVEVAVVLLPGPRIGRLSSVRTSRRTAVIPFRSVRASMV